MKAGGRAADGTFCLRADEGNVFLGALADGLLHFRQVRVPEIEGAGQGDPP